MSLGEHTKFLSKTSNPKLLNDSVYIERFNSKETEVER